VWWFFAAPRAIVALPLAGVLAVKVVLFVLSGSALWRLGHPLSAEVFVGIAIANAALAGVDRKTHMRAGRDLELAGTPGD
jgi:hypothetical protein